VYWVREQLEVSERRVCRVVGQARSTQRQEPSIPEEEDRLRTRIVTLACQYGRYGYRRITGLLRNEGWRVNHKRVERIWRQEGLKVPQKQPRRRRLWLNDGSCLRLRPERKDHVWSYDFVSDRTSDGRPLKMLTIMDEYTRESLAIHVARQITAIEVIEQLAERGSSPGVSLTTSGRTTGRSSRQRSSEAGYIAWASKPFTSSQEAPGRTATSNHSMASSGMNC
jgi:putative transposase